MASEFDSTKKILTMLKKSINRLIRQNYYNRKQTPKILIEIEICLNDIRIWIDNHHLFENLNSFYAPLGGFIKELGVLINQLWERFKPKPGKKIIPKKRRIKEQNNLMKSINKMLEHLSASIKSLKDENSQIGTEFEQAMEKSFIKKIFQKFKKKVKNLKNEYSHTGSFIKLILKLPFGK